MVFAINHKKGAHIWENFQKQMRDCLMSGFVLNAKPEIKKVLKSAESADQRIFVLKERTLEQRSRIKKALA